MTKITMRTPYAKGLEQVIKLCNHIAVVVNPEANTKEHRCEYIEVVTIFCAECAEFHYIKVLIN